VALVIGEEKTFCVVFDRAANGSTELIAFVIAVLVGGIKKIPRLEIGITVEFKSTAMKFIRTRLGGGR